jgi:hypothetical protein
MSRTHPPAIRDLASYAGETMTPKQAAALLEIDIRAVYGLIQCGVLECESRRTREYFVYTASVRALDQRQRAPHRAA